MKTTTFNLSDYDMAIEQTMDYIDEMLKSAEIEKCAEGILLACDLPIEFTQKVVKQALQRYADNLEYDREIDLACNVTFAELFD